MAGPGHDGMTDGIINVAATDYDDEYCVIDEMDIAVRNARNNVLREATAGKFNTVFHYKKVVFLICIISGVYLNLASANVMNPIQLDNPLLQDRYLLRTVCIAPIVDEGSLSYQDYLLATTTLLYQKNTEELRMGINFYFSKIPFQILLADLSRTIFYVLVQGNTSRKCAMQQ